MFRLKGLLIILAHHVSFALDDLKHHVPSFFHTFHLAFHRGDHPMPLNRRTAGLFGRFAVQSALAHSSLYGFATRPSRAALQPIHPYDHPYSCNSPSRRIVSEWLLVLFVRELVDAIPFLDQRVLSL